MNNKIRERIKNKTVNSISEHISDKVDELDNQQNKEFSIQKVMSLAESEGLPSNELLWFYWGYNYYDEMTTDSEMSADEFWKFLVESDSEESFDRFMDYASISDVALEKWKNEWELVTEEDNIKVTDVRPKIDDENETITKEFGYRKDPISNQVHGEPAGARVMVARELQSFFFEWKENLGLLSEDGVEKDDVLSNMKDQYGGIEETLDRVDIEIEGETGEELSIDSLSTSYGDFAQNLINNKEYFEQALEEYVSILDSCSDGRSYYKLDSKFIDENIIRRKSRYTKESDDLVKIELQNHNETLMEDFIASNYWIITLPTISRGLLYEDIEFNTQSPTDTGKFDIFINPQEQQFQYLVELKSPESSILRKDNSGNFKISSHLSDALSQVARYKEEAHNINTEDREKDYQLEPYPNSVIVIGRDDDWIREKILRLNQVIRGDISIYTYDHLCSVAREYVEIVTEY